MGQDFLDIIVADAEESDKKNCDLVLTPGISGLPQVDLNSS